MPYVVTLFWNTGMFETTLEDISERPVAECTVVQVADALTRSFDRPFRPENVDPFARYVYFGESGPVAVVLLTRRVWTSRVGANQIQVQLGRLPLQDLADEFPRMGERRSSWKHPSTRPNVGDGARTASSFTRS